MRWHRQPLVHFLVLGGALFAAERALQTPAAPAPARASIEIDAARLREEFRERTGLAPTAGDEAALVAQAVEEELLYREALARGLDRHDRSIRHRLAEKMRFLSPGPERPAAAYYAEALALGLDRDDRVVRRLLVEKMRLLLAATAGADAPDDEALARHVAAHPQRYGRAPRVRLWHVFAGASAPEAGRLLAALRAGAVPPEDGVRRGRPFPLGGRLGPMAEPQLARLFGADFARAALALPPGAWSGPVASTHGLHLVWIERREEAAPPDLDAVRGRAREALRAERRPERLRRAVAELRRRWDVRVTGGAS